jgi:hypothetical protein
VTTPSQLLSKGDFIFDLKGSKNKMDLRIKAHLKKRFEKGIFKSKKELDWLEKTAVGFFKSGLYKYDLKFKFKFVANVSFMNLNSILLQSLLRMHFNFI